MLTFSNDFLDFYTHAYKAVTDFRRVMDLPIGTKMTEIESANHTALYVEELTELAVAKNKIDQADAIIDSIYVCMGRCVQAGVYQANMQPFMVYPIFALYNVARTLKMPVYALFDEIQSSNMSKTVTDQDSVKIEVEHLTSKGLVVEVIEKQGYYIFKAAKDCPEKGIKKGKVLKPSSYRAANLKPILYPKAS